MDVTAGQGKAGRGAARYGMDVTAGRGWAWLGMAWRGKARELAELLKLPSK